MGEPEVRGTEASPREKDLLSYVLSAGSDPISVNVLADGRFLLANRALADLSGYTSDELIGQLPEAVGVWSREITAEVAKSLLEDGFAEFRLELRTKAGEVIRSKASAQVVRSLGQLCAAIVVRPAPEEQPSVDIDRGAAILRAAIFAATAFLRSDGWSDCIDEVLEKLVAASGAQRAYVYENRTDEAGRLAMSIRAEWGLSGLPLQKDLPANHDYPYAGAFERWERELGAGRVILGAMDELPPKEAEILALGPMGSMVVVPVFAGGDWWGFIGFDDLTDRREWSQAEVDALQVSAEALGASIDRRNIKERLTGSEATQRNLVENLPGVVYVEALNNGGDIYVSPQYEQMFGVSAEARMSDPNSWPEDIHPEDVERVVAEERRSNETLEPFRSEYRIQRRDGKVLWVRDQAVVVRDNSGEPLHWLGLMTDISATKEAEERLNVAESRLRTLVEQIPVATYTEGPSGTTEDFYISPQIEAITGYPPEAFEDANFWESKLHPDDKERVLAEEKRTDESGEPFRMEYRYVAADGRTVWLREESQKVGGRGGVTASQGVITDVTEEKLAEDELRRGDLILQAVAFAAERFLQASEWEATMGEVLSRLGETANVSRAYLFQVSEGDSGSVGRETFEWCAPGIASTKDRRDNQGFHFGPEEGEWAATLLAGDVFQGLARDRSEEDRLYLKEEGVLSLIAVPVFLDAKLWGYLGFDDCVEEREWTSAEIGALRSAGSILGAAVGRRVVEERLELAEATQRNLLENMPAVIYTSEIGEEGHETFVSAQHEQLFGFTPKETLADPNLWSRLCHPDDVDAVREAGREADRTGNRYEMEYRMFHRDGHELWVHDESVLIRDKSGEPVYWLGMMSDITRRKQTEEELRRHDAILQAVGFAAAQFLQADSWEECVDDVLKHLGVAGDADRAYIFQNVLGVDDRLRSSLTHEWSAEGIQPQISNPRLQNLLVSAPLSGPGEQPRWARQLAAGEAYTAVRSEFEEEELSLLEPQGILSLLLVPISAAGQWWGFLGLDDCRSEREWSQAELEALRAAGGVLGAAIERRETEAKLVRAEERHRLLVEQLPAVVYITAIDHVSTSFYISPQVEEMLGYSPEEAVANPTLWMDSIHPDDRDMVMKESDRTNETGDPFALDYRIVARDGRTVWVRDEGVIVRDEAGLALHWQGIMFDITDRKQAEEELEQALKLERDVAERLRSLDDMKNTFLTAVSHDLRTPLAAVLGLALTLEREDIGLDDAETRDLAHRIASNARKLERLVTDLLDLDRLSRGILEPNLSRTDLGLLARKVVEELDLGDDHPITVEAESVEISLDTAKVERIVENLVANSVRHTPAGTRIWVRVSPEGDGALLAVEDEGPGVLTELREAVFEPFRQGVVPTPSPGVGIGLSLVARFAELHGGRAWVADRDGGGASFRVFFPGRP